MLVVTGETSSLRPITAICSQGPGRTRPASSRGTGCGSPKASVSHAQAMRQGSRIACAPPGIRTGQRLPARTKSRRPPTSSSPPHTVPSVP